MKLEFNHSKVLKGCLWVSVSLLFLCLATVPALSKGASVLRVAATSDVANWDPATATSHTARGPQQCVYQNLVRWDKALNPVPDLAASWEISKDGLAWTFHLQKGYFWNGKPVEAKDVKFSIDRIRDPKTAAARRSSYRVVTAVEAPDPHTVVIRTSSPQYELPMLLADGSTDILSKDYVESLGKKGVLYGRNAGTTLGSGPFKLAEWKSGEKYVMEPNKHYVPTKWGPSKTVGRIVYLIVPEATTRVSMLLRGDVDVIDNVPSDRVKDLEKNPKIKVQEVSSAQQVEIEMNLAVKELPFSNHDVRLALNLAIDRQAVIDSVMDGMGTVAVSPTGPVPGRKTYEPIKYDPKKAKELLEKAGYPKGFSFKIMVPHGHYPKGEEIAVALQGMWMKVGLKPEIMIGSKARWLEYFRAGPPSQFPDKHAWMVGRSAPTLSYNLWRLYRSTQTNRKGGSASGYTNPEVDKLLEAARVEMNPEKRKAHYAKAQDLIWEDKPFVYLWTWGYAIAVREGVKGVFLNQRQRIATASAALR